MPANQLPYDLLEAFNPHSGRGVVCFVGSGPSCAAGLPSWSALLLKIATEVGLTEQIRPYTDNGKFLEAAQFLVSTRSEQDIQERVARIIKDASNLSGPHEIHKLIVSLPFAAIITTNYDLLLTAADTSNKFDTPISQTTSNLRQQLRERFILHLHGHVNDPYTIILSRSGYDDIKFKGQVIQQFLSSIFQYRVVLFIGFGFADNHIEDMLSNFQTVEVIGGGDVFALVPSASPDAVKDVNLRHRSINPIYLPDNGDHGVSEIKLWLENLKTVTETISDSYGNSVVKVCPIDLIDKLKTLLTSNDIIPFLAEALLNLQFRPDMHALGNEGLSVAQINNLFDRLSLSEMRRVLIRINTTHPHPDFQDALSCIPP